MMCEVCSDNRFELIAKAKKDILDSTNIESSTAEMAVLDNILFRCWQMGWLDKYAEEKGASMSEWISVQDRLPEAFESVLVYMPGEAPFETVREGFIGKDGIWHAALFDREPGEVVMWKPLPDPPLEG